MRSYFADTAFWIALSSRRDQYHPGAVEWHNAIIRTGSHIVTTEAILWEWLNALSAVASRGLAADAYRKIHRDPRIEVVPFLPALVDSAVALYRRRPDKNWSLTDCLSFVVMEHRGLTEALTTDRHFEQAHLKACMLQPPSL